MDNTARAPGRGAVRPTAPARPQPHRREGGPLAPIAVGSEGPGRQVECAIPVRTARCDHVAKAREVGAARRRCSPRGPVTAPSAHPRPPPRFAQEPLPPSVH